MAETRWELTSRTVEALRAHGANLELEREVIFYFTAPDAETGRKVVEGLERIGAEPDLRLYDDHATVVVTLQMVAHPELLIAAEDKLNGAIASTGIASDGWEACAVP